MIEIATKILDAPYILDRLLRTGGSYGLGAEALLFWQQLFFLKRGK
jgi:hypothetical protein